MSFDTLAIPSSQTIDEVCLTAARDAGRFPRPHERRAAARRHFRPERNMIAGIVGWVALGLILGFIASKVVNLKGDDPMMGILLGAGGAIAGGVLYTFISHNPVTGFNTTSLLIAGIGAVVALGSWHTMRGIKSGA
jgi:uncharacterized membrane protein YeaQ/YmgE (transglycosylase-associated protein family)